ncbi:hypothetical protein ACSBM8_17045 [Sphingomonas sp. ASY06-1R]|uniref:hypothetical protein n=1 Tax=Sphingomonas sp. ASY06-1R TaxID=3445771 RepID=UPI003FA299EC
MTGSPASPNGRRFTAAQCEALFEAVLIDDVVDAHTELPERITLDFDASLLADGYYLCRQWWKEGVRRAGLVTLIDTLQRDRDLSAADRLTFKYARAKFKHLRFACALFRDDHRYPRVLDWLTVALGHLQDGFKNGQRGKVWRDALLCRLLLSGPVYRIIEREVDQWTPATTGQFRSYILAQIDQLRGVLARETVTGAQFHATRKIISRQSAFYVTILTITGGDEAYKMSRALAAINGLMGSLHDLLVEQRVAGTFDYHRAPMALPDEIRRRLADLVARYDASRA